MPKVINPATEQVLSELPDDTRAQVEAKYKRARASQPSWSSLLLSARAEKIANFRALLKRDAERLARTLTSEVGKPIAQSRNELEAVLGRIDFFLERTGKVLADLVQLVDREHHLEERIVFEPLGVVANISAWNYPYFVGSNVFIPALLCGNAVLYKPSEFATLTGIAIAELMHEAGVPKDVFAAVIGGGATGADLIAQPVDGIFFTGSYATGKRIAEAAAGRLLKLQLELGGKDPVYVCDDIDVAKAAAATADGAFYNNGQSCCSVERIYVHDAIYDSFVDAFLAEVKKFPIGDPNEDATYIGPLTRREQIAVMRNQIDDAVKLGAKLRAGGKKIARAGFYFEPTVLTEVDHRMAVMRDESFGPVIGLQRVKNDDEALKLMADTEYGLTASVYSANEKRARRILSALNVGTAYWNCCDRVSPRLPWSGRGHSGIGSTLSELGIQAFVQPKAWHLRST